MEFQDNEKVIIAGCFIKYRGVVVRRIFRVNCSGDIDGTFQGGDRFGSATAFIGPNVLVIKKNTSTTVDNGRIICGGNFTSYNNQPRKCIVRLDSNGNLDGTTFGSGFGPISASVYALSLNNNDTKIAVGGQFTTYNTITACNGICVLNYSDGSVDTTFVRGNGFGFGVGGVVEGLDYQSDNKLIVVGRSLNQYTCNNQTTTGLNNIVRLNTDGSLDATFLTNIGTGPEGGSGTITTIKIQSDDKIIIGGSFTTFNGIARNNIVRLNSNGSVDTSFDIGADTSTVLSSIEKILIQTDGKIILLGLIVASYGFRQHSGNLRLNTNGIIDTTYNNPSFGFSFNSLIRGTINQQNVVVAGQTNAAVYNSVNIASLAKINPDGSIQCDNFPEKCCTSNGGITASTYRVRNCSDLGTNWTEATNPGACG